MDETIGGTIGADSSPNCNPYGNPNRSPDCIRVNQPRLLTMDYIGKPVEQISVDRG